MAVETDDDRATFFDAGEFGVEATWESTALTGILFRPTDALNIDAGADIVMARTSFVCAEIDLPADAGEDDVIVIGADSWRVRTMLPDGTGMVRAELEIIESDGVVGMLDFSVAAHSQYIPLI